MKRIILYVSSLIFLMSAAHCHLYAMEASDATIQHNQEFDEIIYGPSELKLECLTKQNLPEFKSILKQAFRSIAAQLQMLVSGNRIKANDHWFAGRLDGVTVGIALLVNESANDNSNLFSLEYFVIDKKFQNKGIGSYFLKTLFNHFDCEQVHVQSLQSAVPFYKKCGFETDGETSDLDYYSNEDQCMIWNKH